MSWRDIARALDAEKRNLCSESSQSSELGGQGTRAGNCEDSENIEHRIEKQNQGTEAAPEATRLWLVDGRESSFSPPASLAQVRAWYPSADLVPVADERMPPPAVTGDDARDWDGMVDDVRLALRGRDDVAAVVDSLTGCELSDWRTGHFGTAEIVAFADAVELAAEDAREAFEERAAVMEFEAGLPRAEAERLASDSRKLSVRAVR
ncbi:MAG: hypothetical protein ACOY5H_04975 [Pseudomonadota bacterium]